MNRKIKNTLVLVALLIFLLAAGGAFIYFIQHISIEKKNKQLAALKANNYDSELLTQQYKTLLVRAASLDSILAARKFNIPKDLSSIKFFDFLTGVTNHFTNATQIDVKYMDVFPEKDFFYHEYDITGGGTYNDIYKLIFAIEQSKELKKIKEASFANYVQTDEEGVPQFYVTITMIVDVYYSLNDRFATTLSIENDIDAPSIYNPFYPLVRNEIPPNLDDLLDVQGSRLLALIPEGAFLSDSKGNTYLLWEGEQVYLGYLTKIDYDNNKVSFILNKGGIIEKVVLNLERENQNQNKMRFQK
ncbi:MAG: hypothetical protein K8H86_08300 [Ignavibacteriaceae bacterium]|nr:hypothetical protein [Ignavibacteriaceae bacterium]